MNRVLAAGAVMVALAGAGLAYRALAPLAAAGPVAASAERPVPVIVAPVVRKAVPLRIETIGSVEPLASVAIKSRIDGQIVEVHFREGQNVKAGEVLFTLDDRAAEAQLRQAEAQLARDRAHLANARREVERQAELVAKRFASGQKYDEVRTAAESLEATVRSDEAAVENLQVQLSYHTIASPIDGRAGAVALKTGSTVKANDAGALVTINQIHPIYVAFAVPQHEFVEVREAMRRRPLEAAVLPLGGARPVLGQLAFLDNAIDVATGTITLKAVFANEDERLWPGQFVNVALTLRIEGDALTVPAPAIQAGQSGPYVYVVKPDMTAEPRDVVVKRQAGEEAVIAGGLAEGEQVVVDGQLRLAKGTRVEPRPHQAPGEEKGTS